MIDLRDHWREIAERIGNSPELCVLLDFDGTLVPLQDRPDQVILPIRTREVLEEMSAMQGITVGVISGRAVTDLLARVGIEGIWYVGNHGFEIVSPEGHEKRYFGAEQVRVIGDLLTDVVRTTAHIPGIFIENKGPVLSFHTRQVETTRLAEAEGLFTAAVSRFSPGLSLMPGRFVLEARPVVGYDKGTAVQHIRWRLSPGHLCFYFGDDYTDQAAFRELGPSGVAVHIGRALAAGPDHFLPDPAAVFGVLRKIASKWVTASGTA
jgi:trehalose 6-phosphate phosphatase